MSHGRHSPQPCAVIEHGSPHVVVMGSVNGDERVRVPALPKPGVTVLATATDRALGGKGANQAVAAARAGARVRIVGAVGRVDGTPLLDELRAHGVDTSGLACVPGTASGRAIVLVDAEAENTIVVIPGANHALTSDVVREGCAALSPGDVVVLQHEIPPPISRLAARLARAAGATVVWNAAPAPVSLNELVPNVDLLVVNEHELAAIAALLGVDTAAPHEQIRGVADRTGSDVVCTLGARGAIFCHDGSTGAMPARRVDAVDTTAAGDTFVGYLAALAHEPFEHRLRTALAAASLTVTRPGAASSIPTYLEVTSPHQPRGATAHEGPQQ
ncbi:ribokinase [Oerskovia sp. Root22]|uniref:ribokinase n=1 Tax=Oerskovia sp. Root22 TaxID=1736494 RepID=UPI0009E6C710|nr:ribokinase [Oerskovia sp. Root22]